MATVRRCFVVNASGHDGKEVLVGFVQLRDGATFSKEVIRDYCLTRIAKFKVPKALYELSEVPVASGANGAKVQKEELRKMATALLEASTQPDEGTR
jgi:acyl-CoA synthetase (AMP-forming)/AMP-acid ligase II